MHHNIAKLPLLVIVGETASGKSALAMHLATHFDGRILCADSRTVYTGMDIGTAKPSETDRRLIRHYGLDLVKPDERYTVADFKSYAMAVINEVSAAKKIPIMVGGTGLYIDAVLYDYQFRPLGDQMLRNELNTLSVQELQQRLKAKGISLPANQNNPRHLVRALETGGASAGRSELRRNMLILGVQVDKELLRQRIIERVDEMVRIGLVDEARIGYYLWVELPSITITGVQGSPGLLTWWRDNRTSEGRNRKNHMDLAKRQRTWFKRNKSIHWLMTEDKQAEAVDIATTFLNK